MLSQTIQHYGYWVVFGGILLEDFGLPAPGETLLISSGVLAAKGKLSLAGVISFGMAGAFLGDNIGFAIGYFGGRRLVLRYGRTVFLSEERLRRMEQFFARHGGKIVVPARFFEGLRQFNGILAGISGMPWRRFWVFNLTGAALWTGWWAGAAYFLGRRTHHLAGLFYEAAGLAVVVLAGYALYRWFSQRRSV